MTCKHDDRTYEDPKAVKIIENLTSQIVALRAEVERLKAKVEDLIWNLAGCSTFALGYGLGEPFDKTKARAAMYDVLKCAKDRDRWREIASFAAEAIRYDLNGKVGDGTLKFTKLLEVLALYDAEALKK